MDSLSAVYGMRVKATTPREISVQVRADTDIVAARQKGREFARELGFTSMEVTLVTTAVSELARNILHYAKRGDIGFAIIQKDTRRGLRIIARDDGPGIPDVEIAMREGFSTSGGLGLGLPGVKRLMDEFNIVSKIGCGTTVTVKQWSMNMEHLPFHSDDRGSPFSQTTERLLVDSPKSPSRPKPKRSWQVIVDKSSFVLDLTEKPMDRKSLEDFNKALERRVAANAEALIRRDADLSRALEVGKQLREQLRQSQKLESIGTLAAGLVHDFNNVLHVVQGYAAALVEPQVEPDEVVKAGEAIVRAVEQGAALARQLLTTAGKSEAKLEPTDVNGLLRPLIDFMTAAFPHEVTLYSELDGDMPNIIVDANQINQAVLNLCVNAKDAMGAGGKLVVRTRTVDGAEIRGRFPGAESDRYVSISVADTGSGMDEATRSHIFDPFFTTKGPGKGTGLGLSVTAAIVQSQNGFIDVQSEPGRGSTFKIYLPIAKLPALSAEAADTFAVKEVKTAAGHGETVLFIEDEPERVAVNASFSHGRRI